VEARKDTTVVIHPLADDRRILPIEKRGEILTAPPEFMLIISFNPGYQSIMKDLKPSTRQRFVSLEFKFPEEGAETAIVAQESGVDQELARRLVKLGHMTRNLKERGLDEGASTRLLIHAGKLIQSGIDARESCRAAITNTLTDDEEMQISMGKAHHVPGANRTSGKIQTDTISTQSFLHQFTICQRIWNSGSGPCVGRVHRNGALFSTMPEPLPMFSRSWRSTFS
jgi:hypothetical protein